MEESFRLKEPTETLLSEERVFRPLPEIVVEANISPNEYKKALEKGQRDLEGFWEEAAEKLEWFKTVSYTHLTLPTKRIV